jgi:hypothetical protein
LTRQRLVGLLLAAALVAVVWRGRPSGERLQGANAAIDWSLEPKQGETDRAAFELPTRKGPATVTPRASYDIAAVAKSSERYWFDPPALVSPLDVVLAWGDVPRPAYDDKLDYSQSWRFFFWRTDDLALDAGYVIAHTANTHLIPANRNVRRALLAIDRGDEVRLRGLLVDVATPDFRWPTSLIRTDHGDEGCEILYVESAQIGERVYR